MGQLVLQMSLMLAENYFHAARLEWICEWIVKGFHRTAKSGLTAVSAPVSGGFPAEWLCI